ncbi:hypothetical protein [Cardinium endosymbiont of Philonthus spinipes]|uniref:hypothetical protein n=1 Tax=Cardinium endosymbiont of Philonthus spinipes TaxID=3077941 RepID=UPI00313C1F54
MGLRVQIIKIITPRFRKLFVGGNFGEQYGRALQHAPLYFEGYRLVLKLPLAITFRKRGNKAANNATSLH